MALEWLKDHNPIYCNIIISSHRLSELPLDGVPDEITSFTRHLDDTSLLAQETDRYIPDNPANDEGN